MSRHSHDSTIHASGYAAPGAADEDFSEFPVDEHIAPPETRVEYLDGEERYALPALPPHAIRHSDLAFVLRAHAARGYQVAVDMLTRTDESSDFAPDASIFPTEMDPTTGGRRLEELAFEVSDKQRLSVPTQKARKLAARGVRRVFCLLVKQKRVLEWSKATDGWQTLARDALIDDPCLVRPIPVASLLDAAMADDAVAQALLDRHVPALERALEKARGEAEARGEARGETRECAKSILAVFAARKIEVPDAIARQIADCRDRRVLRAWLRRATIAGSAAEVVSKPSAKRR